MGEKNITWPDCPNYFAVSSGTTGETSKRIPVTDAMVKSILNNGTQQVGLPNKNGANFLGRIVGDFF